MKKEYIEVYIDKNIEKIVQELLTEMYPPEAIDNKGCSYRYKMAKTTYYSILKNIKISDLTPTFLVSKIPTLTCKEAMYLIRVCIKIAEYKLNKDLERLLNFKERIMCNTWSTYRTDIINIFNSNDYGYFQSKGLLKSKAGMKLFFLDIETDDIKDVNLKKYMKEFVSVIKSDESHTINVRINHLYDFEKIKNDLSKKNISKWTRKMFSEIDNKILCIKFLEFLEKKTDLPDDISDIIKFKMYLLTRRGVDECWNMICNNDIRQCFLVNMSNTKQPKLSFYYTDVPYGTKLFDDIKKFVNTIAKTHKDKELKIFAGEFLHSLGNSYIKTVDDLSYQTYLNSGRYFEKYDKKKKFYSYIYSFYVFLINQYNIEIFKNNNIPNKIFLRPGVLELLMQSYTIEHYNPLEDVPVSDKWILMYDSRYDTGTYHNASDSFSIDFSDIKNSFFKKLAKMFIWQSNISINKKVDMLRSIKVALNYIQDLRTGKEVSIYYKENNNKDNSFTINEAQAYKKYVLSKEKSHLSLSNDIFNFSKFLSTMKETNQMQVPEAVFHFLRTNVVKENNANAIPDESLKKLIHVFEKRAENGTKDFLYSLIFKIALDTEMRISEILSLDINCVQETSKHGEYVLVRKRKSQLFQKEIMPITSETKSTIDRAIDATKSYRLEAMDNIKEKLFIVKNEGTLTVRRLTLENFRKYMIECCQEANIPKYTASNLRDTYMTKAKMYKLKNNLSDMEQSVLNGHITKDVDMNHYVDISIETMLESVYGIILGDIDVNGQVLNQVDVGIATTENEVSNGCGYCSSKNCNNLTYLDCIMCRDFVTMPSRLYFFEEQIKTVDEKIKNSTLPHDREDAVNIKRLLVKYIAKIKEIEGVSE